MLEKILTNDDCVSCKICCKFEPAEIIDAPVVTAEIKNLILETINPEIQFSRMGNLWQINLEKIDDRDKYVCPIFDPDSGCKLKENRPFDCQTWPFYIMDFRGQIVMTLSPSCPIVNNYSVKFLRDYVQQELAQYMLNVIQENPDLLTEYHDNATILSVLCSKADLINNKQS